jgi:hypothetical protein
MIMYELLLFYLFTVVVRALQGGYFSDNNLSQPSKKMPRTMSRHMYRYHTTVVTPLQV